MSSDPKPGVITTVFSVVTETVVVRMVVMTVMAVVRMVAVTVMAVVQMVALIQSTSLQEAFFSIFKCFESDLKL
ncbi:hypothetical protein HanIR_Chr14g0683711 [Helianthus annuus]|nr:hypothetical protein HanIR_Chr14g0683711 [Helianthus annuus]